MAIFWFKKVKYLNVWLRAGSVGVFKADLVVCAIIKITLQITNIMAN